VPPWRDEQVDRRAERRVGGDAGIAVRAAALQREHEVLTPARSSRFARLAMGSIAWIASTPFATVFRVPPTSWIVMVRKVSLSVML